MRGAIPPLSITPSWRGDQLKHRDNLTFAVVLLLGLINLFVLCGMRKNWHSSGRNLLLYHKKGDKSDCNNY
jgi:hypothetical protein